MSAHFGSSDIAELYSKYGLVYPDGVYDLIERKLNESLPAKLNGNDDGKKWNLALDVGCGAGQGTARLCKYFSKVIGIDSSVSQIHCAAETFGSEKPGRMSFICHDATQLSEIFVESSVDLVVTCQALHWYDRVKFYEECKKVLRPGGLLVAYGSGYFQLEDEKAEKIKAELLSILKEWSGPEMMHLEDRYARIYPELKQHFSSVERDDSMVLTTKSSPEDFFSYLSMWSAYRNYSKTNPDKEDLLAVFRRRLMDLYKDNNEVIIERKSKIFVLIARNA